MRKLELDHKRIAGRPVLVKEKLAIIPEIYKCEGCEVPFLRDEVVYVMRAPPYKPSADAIYTGVVPTVYNLCQDCSGKDLGDLT